MKFQSHIGAIRIQQHGATCAVTGNFNPTLVQLECGRWELNSCFSRHFNPTLVQLECGRWELNSCFSRHFNPTLVQLESCLCSKFPHITARFQSHIGAIRMAAEKPRFTTFNINFNPTLVQLECIAEENSGGTKRISIPHWCN